MLNAYEVELALALVELNEDRFVRVDSLDYDDEDDFDLASMSAEELSAFVDAREAIEREEAVESFFDDEEHYLREHEAYVYLRNDRDENDF